MLKDNPISATIPASDLERAERFYAEKLGMTPDSRNPEGLWYDCGGGTRFLLFTSAGAASGDHTQAGFEVSDLESEVNELRGRGVQFLEYDFPGLKTVNGIADISGRAGQPAARAAWFKDSEGNVISLAQGTRS